jgi:hypothetical protein
MPTSHDKFVKKETKLTNLVNNEIISVLEGGNRLFNNEVFNSENIAECPRKIVYKSFGLLMNQSLSLDRIKNDSSIALKKKWIDLLSKSSKINFIEKNITVSDCNYNLSGEVDAVIEINDYKSLVLIKELESDDYILAQLGGGAKSHVIELMADIWMAELENGILICENKNTNEYFVSHIIIHQPIIETIKKKYYDLNFKKTLNQLPSRPYKNMGAKECILCKYRLTCWEKGDN